MRKTQTQNKRAAIAERVTELHKHSIKWFNKFISKVIPSRPLTKRDALAPESSKEYTVGINPVDTTKPAVNPEMKYVISPFKKITQHMNLFIILLFIILAFIFASCGSDNPVTPTNPGTVETAIFSLDTFNLSGMGLIGNDTSRTISDTTIDSLKCVFTVQSDCDTTSQSKIIVDLGNTYYMFYYRQMNNSYTLYGSMTSDRVINVIMTFLSPVNKFIKISNFKVYKVN